MIGHFSSAGDSDATFLFLGRWGMGFLAAGLATYMTLEDGPIRSTQSATGILYIAMIFVCFGELLSLVLAGDTVWSASFRSLPCAIYLRPAKRLQSSLLGRHGRARPCSLSRKKKNKGG